MTDKLTNFVIEFDYNLEALQKIKEGMLSIDKTNIEEVEGAVKQLVKIRRGIETKGKSYRDEANAFNKMVISKEKEYVEIIEPLEIEYKEILEKDKQAKIVEARMALLPMKKDQLSLLKVKQSTDEEILALSDEEWVIFYQAKADEHKKQIAYEVEQERLDKERKEREERMEKELKKRHEEEKAAMVKKAEEDKIKAVEDAKREVELEAKKKEEAEQARIKKESDAKKAQEEAEAKAKAEMEADQKYKDFLKENNFNLETDIIEEHADGVYIYRFVASFKK